MSRIIALRVQIPASDDCGVKEVQQLLQTAVRNLGCVTLEGQDGATELLDRSIWFNAADIKLGAETTNRKRGPKLAAMPERSTG